MAELILRPARADEFEYVFALHKEGLGGYIESAWGWDEAGQRRDLRAGFDAGNFEVGNVQFCLTTAVACGAFATGIFDQNPAHCFRRRGPPLRPAPRSRHRPAVGWRWWARQGSNLQPDRYERSALTS